MLKKSPSDWWMKARGTASWRCVPNLRLQAAVESLALNFCSPSRSYLKPRKSAATALQPPSPPHPPDGPSRRVLSLASHLFWVCGGRRRDQAQDIAFTSSKVHLRGRVGSGSGSGCAWTRAVAPVMAFLQPQVWFSDLPQSTL